MKTLFMRFQNISHTSHEKKHGKNKNLNQKFKQFWKEVKRWERWNLFSKSQSVYTIFARMLPWPRVMWLSRLIQNDAAAAVTVAPT